MTEPAKVYKVQNDISNVEYPQFNDNAVVMSRSTLRNFGKKINVGHVDYHEMANDILDRDYKAFMRELEENCKLLFVTDPVYSHHYDSLSHTDNLGWSVRLGSPQLDYFSELFKCKLTHYNDLEVRWIETEVKTYPQTLRECFKQAWVIIKRKFKHE